MMNLSDATSLATQAIKAIPPLEILVELRQIEQEILKGLEELEGMLR